MSATTVARHSRVVINWLNIPGYILERSLISAVTATSHSNNYLTSNNILDFILENDLTSVRRLTVERLSFNFPT